MSTIRAKFRPARALMATVIPEAHSAAPVRARMDRRARMLALAHHIDRLIEVGEVASYGEVARVLGLTQPRLSQIMGMLLLSPAIQERVLLGGPGVGARDLQRAAREAEWESQVRTARASNQMNEAVR